MLWRNSACSGCRPVFWPRVYAASGLWALLCRAHRTLLQGLSSLFNSLIFALNIFLCICARVCKHRRLKRCDLFSASSETGACSGCCSTRR